MVIKGKRKKQQNKQTKYIYQSHRSPVEKEERENNQKQSHSPVLQGMEQV